jgi:ABC-type bacteriocin/lantibiotic exporter with double-glycine peptidase domain
LSGGQRQRISIARIFLRDPKVLILDEATSALDKTTEKSVIDALERLMIGRTTIVIGHSKTSLRAVDNVVFLDGGRVVHTTEARSVCEQLSKSKAGTSLAKGKD